MRPGQGEKPEAWIPETWCIVNRWPDNEQKENQPYTQQGDEGSGNTRWTQLGWIDIITQNEAKLNMLNTGRGAVKNNRNKLWPDSWLDTGTGEETETGDEITTRLGRGVRDTGSERETQRARDMMGWEERTWKHGKDGDTDMAKEHPQRTWQTHTGNKEVNSGKKTWNRTITKLRSINTTKFHTNCKTWT